MYTARVYVGYATRRRRRSNKGAWSAAPRDSKRDVTANPIRKTQLDPPPRGQSHADWPWQQQRWDGIGLKIGLQSRSLWCCQWGLGGRRLSSRRGWSRGERGERIPPVTQRQNARPQCHALAANTQTLRHCAGWLRLCSLPDF